MSHDWRLDPGSAARDVLTVMNDRSCLVRNDENRLVVRWHPGPFVRSLIETMTRADRANLALLSMGFPAHARAIDRYKNAEHGVEGLRQQAEWTTED